MLVYITEDFYVDFVNDAVKRNSRKIKFNANKKAIELVKKMNKDFGVPTDSIKLNKIII